jgi:hypothetical protein
MNSSIHYSIQSSSHVRVSVRSLIVLTTALFVSACSSGQVTRVAAAGLGEARPSAAKADAPTRSLPPQPSCPPAGVLPLQRSLSDTGHHKVALSWNAGIQSPGSHAVGYCLYRSRKQNLAKKNPTCKQCERVNSVPVSTLNCLDDLVEDGATYYYVVTAIDPESRLSSSSNEITALIPPGNQSSSVAAAAPAPPLCRGSAAK